jgi:hypothetical protein
MNPLIITIIVSLATYVLSIFAATWLQSQHMTRHIDDLGKVFDAKLETMNVRVGSLEGKITLLDQNLNARIGYLEQSMDARLKALETRIIPMESHFQEMHNRFDKLDARIAHVETGLEHAEQFMMPSTNIIS